MMNRLLFFSLAVGSLLLGILAQPSLAQENASSENQWEIGVQALQVSVGSRSAPEIGVRVSRRLDENWGLQASAHHLFSGAPPPNGFGARYDRRRVGAAVTAFWEPLQFRTGPIDHTIRLHAGPMVQGLRKTRKNVVICATGLPKDIDSFIERRYPKQEQHVRAGAEFGLGYGVTYGAVTTRVFAVIRALRFDQRARSEGVTGPERRSAEAGMSVNVRF